VRRCDASVAMDWVHGKPCPRPRELVGGNNEHYFSGYGWDSQYHPECCPRAVDGMDCDDHHPNPLQGPWPQEAVDELHRGST
jgi:hypothetical protein